MGTTTTTGKLVRAARDEDADGLIALIGAVSAEYPGRVLDVDAEAPELRTIATSFAALRGEFWVVEQATKVIACVGYTPALEGRGIELRKLYVQRDARRQGLGSRLCARVEQTGVSRGAEFVELWSDTRFDDAARLFEGLGYERGASTREPNDLSHAVECYFRKRLPSRR